MAKKQKRLRLKLAREAAEQASKAVVKAEKRAQKAPAPVVEEAPAPVVEEAPAPVAAIKKKKSRYRKKRTTQE